MHDLTRPGSKLYTIASGGPADGPAAPAALAEMRVRTEARLYVHSRIVLLVYYVQ